MAIMRAMAPRMAPTTEPAFDPALSPEEVFPAFMAVDTCAGEALVDVIAGEALVDVIAGEALVIFGLEVAAADDVVPKLVCIAPVLVVGVGNSATVARPSAALAVVIPPMGPQPQSTVASLLHSNL